MRHSLWFFAGIICLLFAVIPSLFYGILNAGVIALGLCGSAFLLFDRIRRQLSHNAKRAFYSVSACCIIVFGALSAAMLWHGWFNPPPATGTDAVIVLGSKVIGDRPSKMLARRLQAAAEYLKLNPSTICVVSGGQGADELYPEAQVMAAYIIELGIEPERILMEDSSVNTQQNLEFSCKLLRENGYQVEHITVATDGFHQMRAAVLAKKGSIQVSALSSHCPWGLYPAYWVREWPALLKALLVDNGV